LIPKYEYDTMEGNRSMGDFLFGLLRGQFHFIVPILVFLPFWVLKPKTISTSTLSLLR